MKSLVSKTIILLTLLLLLAFTAVSQAPPPCKCSCSGGTTSCSAGQWACCICENNVCSGRCINAKKTDDLAASVLSEITGENLTEMELKEDPKKYSDILKRLLQSGVNGNYTISYGDREVNFGFTNGTVRILEQRQKQLENSR